MHLIGQRSSAILQASKMTRVRFALLATKITLDGNPSNSFFELVSLNPGGECKIANGQELELWQVSGWLWRTCLRVVRQILQNR